MIWPLYRTLFAGVSSKARVVGFTVVALIEIAIAIVLSGQIQNDQTFVAVQLVDKFGLTLIIPLAALVFGTASLGDPIEDGTYVYLWLRPLRRWKITLAAFLATVSLVIPLAVVPTIISGVIVDSNSHMAIGAGIGSLLAGIAYSAVFVLLGQVTQRSLIWGIAYLLIFEQFIARGGKGLGFVSVHSYSVSVLSKSVGDVEISLDYFSRPVAVVAPLVFTAAWLLWSGRHQNRMNVA
jgi:ABC-2 type transport system permease protein